MRFRLGGRLDLFLRLGCLLVILNCAACVTGRPPNEDYNLSRVALDAARAVDAARHSPGYFRKAEDLYTSGQKHYDDREYEDAARDLKNHVIWQKRRKIPQGSFACARAKYFKTNGVDG